MRKAALCEGEFGPLAACQDLEAPQACVSRSVSALKRGYRDFGQVNLEGGTLVGRRTKWMPYVRASNNVAQPSVWNVTADSILVKIE